MDHLDIALRLLLALGLGAVLGLERELRGQPAGLRTHIVVALGSCLFTLASIQAAYVPLGPRADPDATDFTRIASQIVVGIGFLGGGSILRHGTTVRGLTTAANLWGTAALGLAAGLGMWFAATLSTFLVLGCLEALKPVERWVVRLRKHKKRELGAPDDGPRREEP